VQTFGQLEREKHFGARRAAHAFGIEIGDSDDLEFLLAGDDGVGGAGQTRLRGTLSRRLRRGLALRVAHD
jgi:hypothetical protein